MVLRPHAKTVRRSRPSCLLCSLLLAFMTITVTARGADFVPFESGPVRPMALSPGGETLFVVNTPDNHLEIYAVDDEGTLTHEASVPVGMEPVAVAVPNGREAWVVNHLSDSVGIVDLESFVLGAVKGLVDGKARGSVRLRAGNFKDDRGEIYTDAALRALATEEGPPTYTCAPPGSGGRMGIDPDRDAVPDGMDNCPAAVNDGDGVGDACSPSPDEGLSRG